MNEKLVKELQNILGDKKVLTGESGKVRYEHIWKMDQLLEALAVILPRNTEDVSNTLKYCYNNHQK